MRRARIVTCAHRSCVFLRASTQAISFSRRVTPESCKERHESFLPPNKRGGRAPTGASNHWPHHRRQVYAVCANHLQCGSGSKSGSRSPLGAPPRRLPRKLMPWLSPGRASRNREGAGVTHTIERAYSDAPRAPVIVPAGSMPKPPGSGVTNPARRNRARSVSRPSPVDVPLLSRLQR
jgi:hypothetical protein